MKVKSFTLVFLSLCAYSCDFGEELVFPEPDYSIYAQRVYIDSIQLSNIEQTNEDGEHWDDDGTGPDLLLRFWDSERSYKSTEVINDVDLSLPTMFYYPNPVVLDSPYLMMPYFLHIYDFDKGPNPHFNSYEQIPGARYHFIIRDRNLTIVPTENEWLPENIVKAKYFIRTEF